MVVISVYCILLESKSQRKYIYLPIVGSQFQNPGLDPVYICIYEVVHSFDNNVMRVCVFQITTAPSAAYTTVPQSPLAQLGQGMVLTDDLMAFTNIDQNIPTSTLQVVICLIIICLIISVVFTSRWCSALVGFNI